MILDSVDQNWLAINVLQHSGHVSVQTILKFASLKKRGAIFGAENNVHNESGERLGHGWLEYSALLGLFGISVKIPRAALVPRSALGWLVCGLWPENQMLEDDLFPRPPVHQRIRDVQFYRTIKRSLPWHLRLATNSAKFTFP